MQLEMRYYSPSAVGILLGMTPQAGHMMCDRGKLDGIRGIGVDGVERIYLVPESEVRRELERRGLVGRWEALDAAAARRETKLAG